MSQTSVQQTNKIFKIIIKIYNETVVIIKNIDIFCLNEVKKGTNVLYMNVISLQKKQNQAVFMFL